MKRSACALLLFACGLAAAALPTVAPSAGAGAGPVLVIMAHPDDEALGAAGVIESAVAAGRAVYVAIVSNGDSPLVGADSGYCGAAAGTASTTAHYGLRRDGETIAAMALLGVKRSVDPHTSHVFFLGYPDGSLTQIETSADYTGDPTGLHHTYAEDGDGNNGTCDGDLSYELTGEHSQLSGPALAADVQQVLALTAPVDIYTHSPYDGHPDHAAVYREVLAAAQRLNLAVTIHSTMQHPPGVAACMDLSARQWPSPIDDGTPADRFTPSDDVQAPPVPACSSTPTGFSWGAAGPPNELVPLPPDMTATTEAANRKWQVIAQYASQIDCVQAADGTYPASCGYMQAFVKADEWFWTQTLTPTTTATTTTVVDGTTGASTTTPTTTGSTTTSATTTDLATNTDLATTDLATTDLTTTVATTTQATDETATAAPPTLTAATPTTTATVTRAASAPGGNVARAAAPAVATGVPTDSATPNIVPAAPASVRVPLVAKKSAKRKRPFRIVLVAATRGRSYVVVQVRVCDDSRSGNLRWVFVARGTSGTLRHVTYTPAVSGCRLSRMRWPVPPGVLSRKHSLTLQARDPHGAWSDRITWR